MQLRLHSLALLTLLALQGPMGTPSTAQEAAQDELQARLSRLEQRLPAMLERAAVPGLSIAVTSSERLLWSAAVGQRDARTKQAVNAETVFEAASLSKPVVAYLLLKLVDEELLELDTPLIKYAPLEDIAGDPRHRQLTARLLLSHSGGLPNWRPRGGALEFRADPGSRWIYSGEGFVLLQEVLEELTGDTLQGLATGLVFEPLGMRRSSFIWRPDFASHMALPHDSEGQSRANRRSDRANAAASLLTTAEDYARFLSALMRGEGLSAESHAALQVRTSEINPKLGWGLGIGLETNPGGQALWHWGHNSGYRAYTISYPSRDLALVYFTNSDHGMRLLRDLVTTATGDAEHPAIEHLGYDSYADAEQPAGD